MPQRQEISSLLDAEKKAAEKIEEARKRKAKRLKEAQLEARTEIEQLKNDREADYKVKENEQTGSRKDMEEKSKHLTHEMIETLKVRFDEKKDEVLEQIVTLVSDVEPKAHINARN